MGSGRTRCGCLSTAGQDDQGEVVGTADHEGRRLPGPSGSRAHRPTRSCTKAASSRTVTRPSDLAAVGPAAQALFQIIAEGRPAEGLGDERHLAGIARHEDHAGKVREPGQLAVDGRRDIGGDQAEPGIGL